MRNLHGKNQGIPIILEIFSGFVFVGFLFTFFLPETRGKTLEEINRERDNSVETPNVLASNKMSFLKCLKRCRKKTPTQNNVLEMTEM